jgi:uncharacterized membrane protein
VKSRWRRVSDGIVIAAALAGLAINCWLLWQTLRGGTVAGCGGGPCDQVISSRWGFLLGVPVSAFGAALYLAVLLSLVPALRGCRVPLLAALPGAALWFGFVQAVFLKTFCPVCNAVHAIGLVAFAAGAAGAFRRGVVWCALAFLSVGLLQVYGPVKSTHRLETAPREITFDGGNLRIDPAGHPLLGNPESASVLVECFDYQCAACRTMAGHLEALLSAHPGRVAVILLPVPLEAACNPHLGDIPPHPGSCEVSRIALAVWHSRPDAFAAFHKSLIASPSAEKARSLALGLLTPAQLGTALADPRIDAALRANAGVWKHLSRSTEKLPKLLIRDRRVLHGLPSDTAAFLRVMEAELGLSSSLTGRREDPSARPR